MIFFTRMIYWLSRMLNIISGIALVAMMLLIFINVFFRAAWIPILGTYEFTGLLASIAISFALANCAVNKGHIAITLVSELWSAKIQAIFGTIVAILGTGLYTVLAWQCVKYAMNTMRTGEVSLTTEIPFYPFIFGVAFGLLVLAAVLFIDIFISLHKVLK